MFKSLNATTLCLCVGLLVALVGCGQPPAEPVTQNQITSLDPTRVGHYGYGTSATAEQIAGWDIDVRPDGVGLPPGSGSVEAGEWLYEEKCAECHGSFGEGVDRLPVLAGGQGSLRDSRPTKTIGSYWPYTSTLFDYIRRAMPFAQPESLSADETYALTAYVLYLNDLVEDDFELSQDNLASIKLPNENNFGPDPRPDVANTRCMNDCRDPLAIEVLSETLPTLEPVDLTVVAEVSGKTSGKSVYDQACKLCHETGLAGAPIPSNGEQWGDRLDRGLDSLVSNAIEGITGTTGVMPPKGGFAHLSDEEVRLAVHYMVESLP